MKTTPLAGRHVRLEPFDAALREPGRAAASFPNIQPTRQTVEIGGTFIHPDAWTGHVRDSVPFAVTDLDWPDVTARLARRLGILSGAAEVTQRCAKNADGEQPNVFLNMCEKADWLV